MGNRAYVVFEEGKHRSPAIYLHWNGGPESVYAFLQVLKEYGADQHSPEYSSARFVQLVCNYLGGTLSLGIVTFKRFEQLVEEDNGLYVVSRHRVRRLLSVPIPPDEDTDEDIQGPSWEMRWLSPEEVTAEYQAAVEHPAWNPKPGKDSLPAAIHKANDCFFVAQDRQPA